MAPHSATVRGTKGNPKYDKVKNKDPSKIGDPASLKSESGNSSQQVSNDAGENESSGEPQPRKPSSKEQPHSAKVRGTMSHPDTASKLYRDEAGEMKSKAGTKNEQPRSMLGDPASLKAEKSSTEVTDRDRGAGTSDEEAMKKAAIARKDNETGSPYSKL
ncbi:hypothetical protein EJ08DRAFT_651178 [Tothia fuscella]|uniref:Uncharacterized protein n=1 Tax=Tothia fuscella TaxID=1048955 RepID=A0A9P4NNH8_9PEZI|nr:hypothetical protein EJ08DRAFT_651178 [Tothia fuscella]